MKSDNHGSAETCHLIFAQIGLQVIAEPPKSAHGRHGFMVKLGKTQENRCKSAKSFQSVSKEVFKEVFKEPTTRWLVGYFAQKLGVRPQIIYRWINGRNKSYVPLYT